MKLRKKDVKFETMRGRGNGGQHKNKTDSCVRATHIPTGLQALVDGRSQGANKRAALKELQSRLDNLEDEQRASRKKDKRDRKVQTNERAIRTYDYRRGVVIDHRTGRRAPLKEVLGKGRIDLLTEDF